MFTNPQDLTVLKGAVVVAWVVAIIAAERILPAVERRGGWRRIGRECPACSR